MNICLETIVQSSLRKQSRSYSFKNNYLAALQRVSSLLIRPFNTHLVVYNICTECKSAEAASAGAPPNHTEVNRDFPHFLKANVGMAP